MRYQRFENRIQVRALSGDHAADAVMDVLRREKVGYATLTGLGAVRWVRLAYWNSTTREYEEHEVEEQLEAADVARRVEPDSGLALMDLPEHSASNS